VGEKSEDQPMPSSVASSSSSSSSSSSQMETSNATITIQADGPLPSSYGRMRLTEREMEDLGLGGAAEAPYSKYS
jgi:hypothetical protein